ncbi:MAG: hypothetical protein M2R45_04558 [Verrucomicrobia subdivision 3 bacterium]|nr:hypothetical protein [Limisphaerales bacterium]MCS1416803.1 hypothetical protein [Limisphaerales bacterium]
MSPRPDSRKSLSRKVLAVWHEQRIDASLSSPECTDARVTRFRDLKPIYDWLTTLDSH